MAQDPYIAIMAIYGYMGQDGQYPYCTWAFPDGARSYEESCTEPYWPSGPIYPYIAIMAIYGYMGPDGQDG